MAISEAEWASILSAAEKIATKAAAKKTDFFTATVSRRDEARKVIWVSELGDQAIPVVTHSHDVKYYDTDNSGTVNVKNAVISPHVPEVGDTVFIALEMGEQSLPRCIGVLHGTNWQQPEVEF